MPASKPIEGALRPRPVIGFVVSALFLLAICGAHQPAVHPYTDQPGRLEENRPCYWTLTSLVKEVHGEVVRGPGIVEAEDLSPHDESLRFPYSNQYCQLHRDRHLHVVPVGCSLQDFNPEKFLELIRGRRLVMWGDSVTRQFFMYLSIRLRGHTESTAKVFKETHLPSVGGNCKMHSLPNMDGVRLSRACFDAVAVWEHVCFTYHGNKTALCFVRADTDGESREPLPVLSGRLLIRGVSALLPPCSR